MYGDALLRGVYLIKSKDSNLLIILMIFFGCN